MSDNKQRLFYDTLFHLTMVLTPWYFYFNHGVKKVKIYPYYWKCGPLRPPEEEAGGHEPSEPHHSYTRGSLNSVPYKLPIKCATLVMCMTFSP